MNAAIEFEDVSKRYRLGHERGSLRDAIPALLRSCLRSPRAANTSNSLWALREVSFDVREGEALGIVGSNGAGKTTILKLLSGITAPTEGRIRVNGRTASLIELGAGFHPDLTGRENIYLNGTILGLTRAEIRAQFDSIVAFSELEAFMDTPVKRYSSGMYARLGFAVAVHVAPDVLLVDEVLSVGDAGFREKSYAKIAELVRGGRAVVLVSHYLGAIEGFCQNAIWIEHGQVQASGPVETVLPQYIHHLDQARVSGQTAARLQTADGRFAITRLALLDDTGEEVSEIMSGADMTLRVEYHARQPVERPHFSLGISEGGGRSLALASMVVDGQAPPVLEGRGALECHIARLPLMPRTYQLWGSVRGADGNADLIDWQMWGLLRVADRPEADYAGSAALSHTRLDAPVRLDYRWELAGTPARFCVEAR